MTWIKCEDELPNDLQCVIGYDGCDIYFMRFRQTKDKRHKKKSGRFDNCCDEEWAEEITHWMKLPEYPKKDEP